MALASQTIHGQLQVSDIALALAFTSPLLFFYIAYRQRYTWLMWVCNLGYSAWMILQIKTWWIAYIFGASDSWLEVHRRVFSQSIKLLPSFGRHLAPDAMHLMLQLLLMFVVVSLSITLLRQSRNQQTNGA